MAEKREKPVGIFSAHLEPIYQVWAWILLAWMLYRYFFKLPEWADEFIFKPIVFLGPVFWYVFKKEKKTPASIGLTWKKFFPSLYMGLGFGLIFAVEGVLTHVLKYGTTDFYQVSAFNKYGYGLMIISLATAFSEETLTRGFLFNRLHIKTRKFFVSAVVGAMLFLCLHVPILVTSNKLQGMTLILFFATDIILSFANSMLFVMTGSIVSPVLVHLFWNMTVALYL